MVILGICSCFSVKHMLRVVIRSASNQFHNIFFYGELEKVFKNYYQILLIKSSPGT